MTGSTSRRQFLAHGLTAAASLPLFTGFADSEYLGDFVIKRKTITIPQLPEAFRGFTIGMMSDIHSSPFMNADDMRTYVTAMNALKTDMIVVTGDFVNTKTDEVYPFAEAFHELSAPYGVYGCLGNHDFFAKDVERVAKVVDDCGVRLLRNASTAITKNGQSFTLLGVDDIGRGADPQIYMNAALSSVSEQSAKILLCHKPYYFPVAQSKGIALTLSGHTHGGQIVFGRVDGVPLSIAAMASHYISGHYMIGDAHLYVNDGIGYTGIPVRINCPPELTVLTLA